MRYFTYIVEVDEGGEEDGEAEFFRIFACIWKQNGVVLWGSVALQTKVRVGCRIRSLQNSLSWDQVNPNPAEVSLATYSNHGAKSRLTIRPNNKIVGICKLNGSWLTVSRCNLVYLDNIPQLLIKNS